jgi:hypothetical protein
MSNFATDSRVNLARLQRPALGVGIAGAIVCAAGAWLNPPAFFRAYLAAHIFYLGIAVGCLPLLMLHHLTGGVWGTAIRRPLECGARIIPLLGVLFLPILFDLPSIYLWARPEAASDPLLQHKHIYLNPAWSIFPIPSFPVRAVIYFGAWSVLGRLLSSWSLEQDRTGDPDLPARFQRLSAGGLVVYGVTVTFAGIDWLMSLQPHWYSTIFSAIFAVGQMLAALSFAIMVIVGLARWTSLEKMLQPDVLNDLGNLLLAFVMLWTYMAFSQFLLIWTGNLREEIPWYILRAQGPWGWIAGALLLFHFAVPFSLLLSRNLKRDPIRLAQVAVLVLVMRLLDSYWEIMPALPGSGVLEHWIDPVALAALGGFCIAEFARQLMRVPVLPDDDPLSHGGQEGIPNG